MFFKEGEHIRDRRFEIILRINEVTGPLLKGGHPDGTDEIIRTNLLMAAHQGRPILSGVLRPAQLIDAWWEPDGGAMAERVACLTYSGHIEQEVSNEDAEQVLNRLAINLGRYLQSPKIRIALGEKFWVQIAQNEELSATG